MIKFESDLPMLFNYHCTHFMFNLGHSIQVPVEFKGEGNGSDLCNVSKTAKIY